MSRHPRLALALVVIGVGLPLILLAYAFLEGTAELLSEIVFKEYEGEPEGDALA